MKMQNIADKIKEFRSKLGLTQEELAQKAGIPYATLSKIENDKVKNPTINTLIKIAQALEIKVDDLIEYTKNAKNTK
jgi:transcriptional regulator with XRE-family HTH domain